MLVELLLLVFSESLYSNIARSGWIIVTKGSNERREDRGNSYFYKGVKSNDNRIMCVFVQVIINYSVGC